MKIKEFTICLHCGSDRKVSDHQMELLKPLEKEYKITYNNRIDRHPLIYPSYSQLINHAIVTSHTEYIFFINDRTFPKPHEIKKMLEHLENGFAWTTLWGVAFMAFSKELVRKIGWWDERFVNGGWEDRDWVWRLKEANLAIYESHEASYDQSWKSHLNVAGGHQSTPFWLKKWNGDRQDVVLKNISDEQYAHWDMFIGESRQDISKEWNTWDKSILNVAEGVEGSGPASSYLLGNREIVKNYE